MVNKIFLFAISDNGSPFLPAASVGAAAAAQEPVLRHGHLRRKRSDLLTKRGLCAIRGNRSRHHCVTAFPRRVQKILNYYNDKIFEMVDNHL